MDGVEEMRSFPIARTVSPIEYSRRRPSLPVHRNLHCTHKKTYPLLMGTIKKTGEIKHLGLRLPPALHQRLVDRANKDRRTLNDEVIVLLERVLKLKG